MKIGDKYSYTHKKKKYPVEILNFNLHVSKGETELSVTICRSDRFDEGFPTHAKPNFLPYQITILDLTELKKIK